MNMRCASSRRKSRPVENPVCLYQKRQRQSDGGSAPTIWIANAHRGDGKRFVVCAEEKATAFLRLEAAIRVASVELCVLRNCLLATQLASESSQAE